MLRLPVLLLTAFLLSAGTAAAERAGEFDFYVLALSWSPTYCASAGRGGDPMQCRAAKPYRFIVHGLWPQHERGYPAFCRAGPRDAPRGAVDSILDIMPSRGLARHEWRKHGTCSGLTPYAYFETTRAAFERVKIPPAFNSVADGNRMTPDAVETAFRLANPGLRDNAIAVDCANGRLKEVRICLTRDLAFRSCPAIDRRGCRASNIFVPAPGR
ncbi:ribonuclease T2 family protein [Hongsoonwoonella zoysiae]|uniref:ribonuclease T2 family protein n=1 Tax=Hongsoonwoonella zoysiae TaxID=2821844 RepID=UPI001FEACA29|nr:ribonuclease T [Hongsoonwoonella zoysiae]